MPRGQLQTARIPLLCSHLPGRASAGAWWGGERAHVHSGDWGQSHVCLQLPLSQDFREKVSQE